MATSSCHWRVASVAGDVAVEGESARCAGVHAVSNALDSAAHKTKVAVVDRRIFMAFPLAEGRSLPAMPPPVTLAATPSRRLG
jgi:hypothetical protein